jgi:AcrR family transcriptional regulator
MKKRSVKDRVLLLAKEKFLTQGFYKVSMDSLVQELRTSKSSLYNHFSSKDDLVKAVIDQLDFEINTSLQKILDDDKLTFKGKLIATSEFTKNLLSSVNEIFLKDLEISTPDIWEYYQELRRNRIDRYYRSLFEDGIREGVVRADIDINVILVIYLNLTELPLKQEYLTFLGVKNESIYEDATEVFLKGILVQ